jgi:hypothetical protein
MFEENNQYKEKFSKLRNNARKEKFKEMKDSFVGYKRRMEAIITARNRLLSMFETVILGFQWK